MKVDKNEQNWDKLLHIHTMGRDDSRSGTAGKYRLYPKRKYVAGLWLWKRTGGFLFILSDSVLFYWCGI